MIRKLVTIGVYGFDEEGFFRALRKARVDTFCDVRRRRGLRGREYAFANSRRLQDRLAALDVRYIHRQDLAPSDAMRNAQAREDARAGIARRKREVLGEAFVRAYREVLGALDPQAFADSLGPDARTVALFCVERAPAACHRSLLAEHLAAALKLPVEHLQP